MFYNWAKTVEPLVPPRRAKQRNVRSHALRDELPSKLIRDRNPLDSPNPFARSRLWPLISSFVHIPLTPFSPPPRQPPSKRNQFSTLVVPRSLTLADFETKKKKKFLAFVIIGLMGCWRRSRPLIGTTLIGSPNFRQRFSMIFIRRV